MGQLKYIKKMKLRLRNVRFFFRYSVLILLSLCFCTKKSEIDLKPQAQLLPLLGMENFRIDAEASKSLTTSGVSLIAKHDNELLRLQMINFDTIEEAKKYVEQQKAILNAAYSSMASPYADSVSNKISCSKKFYPKKQGQGKTALLFFPIGNRLVYGVCSQAEAKYSNALFFLYRQAAQKMIKVEYIVPIEKNNLEFAKNLLNKNSSSYENITDSGI